MQAMLSVMQGGVNWFLRKKTEWYFIKEILGSYYFKFCLLHMDMSWFKASCLKTNFLLFDLQILKNYRFKVRTSWYTNKTKSATAPTLPHKWIKKGTHQFTKQTKATTPRNVKHVLHYYDKYWCCEWHTISWLWLIAGTIQNHWPIHHTSNAWDMLVGVQVLHKISNSLAGFVYQTTTRCLSAKSQETIFRAY